MTFVGIVQFTWNSASEKWKMSSQLILVNTKNQLIWMWLRQNKQKHRNVLNFLWDSLFFSLLIRHFVQQLMYFNWGSLECLHYGKPTVESSVIMETSLLK